MLITTAFCMAVRHRRAGGAAVPADLRDAPADTRPASSGYSRSELDLLKECTYNINPARRTLSPETALRCLETLHEGKPSLIERYAAERPYDANRLIGHNSALVELKKTIAGFKSYGLAYRLDQMMTGDTGLADMGFSLVSEQTRWWVSKYMPGEQEVLKDAEIWQESILKDKEEKAAQKNAAAAKREKDMAAAAKSINALSGKSAADQGRYLSRTFDNASSAGSGAPPVHLAAAAGAPRQPRAMTAEEGKAIASAMIRMKGGKPEGYFVDVLGQTAAGRRTLDFYNDPGYAKTGDNGINVGFEGQSSIAFWNPVSRQIRFNPQLVTDFAASRGMTVRQVMGNKAAMKELAVYISPVFVHEAEHQNQTARAKASGIAVEEFKGAMSNVYTMASEDLSYKWEAEHLIEYCSRNGGAACYAKAQPNARRDAEVYMADGMQGLEREKRGSYLGVRTLEGRTARDFKAAQSCAAQLQTLETLQRSYPDLMTPPRKRELEESRRLMNTRFKWYALTYGEMSEAEKGSLDFRRRYSGS